jgi:hypothetical protein
MACVFVFLVGIRRDLYRRLAIISGEVRRSIIVGMGAVSLDPLNAEKKIAPPLPSLDSRVSLNSPGRGRGGAKPGCDICCDREGGHDGTPQIRHEVVVVGAIFGVKPAHFWDKNGIFAPILPLQTSTWGLVQPFFDWLLFDWLLFSLCK